MLAAQDASGKVIATGLLRGDEHGGECGASFLGGRLAPPAAIELGDANLGIPLAPVPRLALTRAEAAGALGMSLNSFERHVQPDLRLIRRGKLRVVPVAELARWLDANAEHVLPGTTAA